MARLLARIRRFWANCTEPTRQVNHRPRAYRRHR